MQEKTRAILFGRPKKKKSDDHQLSRRDIISLMFKVAFLEAMALSIILPSVVSTGEIPTPQQFGCVFDSVSKTGCQSSLCNVKQSSYFPGGATDSGPDIDCLVTFPHAFASAPKSITLNWANMTGILCPYICTSTLYSGNGFGTSEETTFNQASGSTASVWTAMPAALTEIFGVSFHESAIDISGQESCGLFANVLVPGTATAILKVQYQPASTFPSGAWNDLLPGFDTSIATAGLDFNVMANPFPIGATTGQLGGIFVRVVGSGGNGVVSPSFGKIFLYCSKGTFTDLHYGYDPNSVTTTGFTIVALSPVANANQISWTFSWTAQS